MKDAQTLLTSILNVRMIFCQENGHYPERITLSVDDAIAIEKYLCAKLGSDNVLGVYSEISNLFGMRIVKYPELKSGEFYVGMPTKEEIE